MAENIKLQECDKDSCLAYIMAKENKDDIKTIKDDNNEKNITLAIIQESIKTMEKSMIKMSIKLDEMLNKPNKILDSLAGTAIGAIVGGLIAILIAKNFA